MKSPEELKKKFDACRAVFGGGTTTLEKLTSVSPLLKGVNPTLDTYLIEYDKNLNLLKNVLEGDVVQLSTDALPENTEEEKKRKAALLLFLKSWRGLESEMARVEAEFAKTKEGGQASSWGRIFAGAAGPLGIITILAVGAVSLQATAVSVTIENNGCGTLQPSVSLPIPLPGISLPKEPIPSGGSAVAQLPPLTFTVDGTEAGKLSFSSFGMNLSFNLGNANDITFNGESLLGKVSTIPLSEEKNHTLTLSCT